MLEGDSCVPWRRCPSCRGVCHWHDTDWVCDECGDEWPPDVLRWPDGSAYSAESDRRLDKIAPQ